MNSKCCDIHPLPNDEANASNSLAGKVADLFKNGACSLWVWDSESNELDITGGLDLGNSLEDWMMKIHPRDQSVFSEAIENASHHTPPVCEYRMRCGNVESWRTVKHTFVSPSHMRPSQVHSIVELLSDTTKGHTFGDLETSEKKRGVEVLAQLQQAQKLASIGKLASGVAHDFNNSLTVIQGHLMLLEMAISSADNEQSFESLELLRDATEQASGLSKQLLMLGRQSQPNFEQTDLHEIIEDFVRMMKRIIDTDIEFETALTADCSKINADTIMIGQVLMNLVVNARDAMSGKGRICIGTEILRDPETHRKAISLTISDSGSGIPEDSIKKIFEPFYSTKERGKGTGLGLANVASIIREHSGQIQVKESSSEGTTFEIRLPVEEKCATEKSTESTAPASNDGALLQGTKILLVEDEAAVRKLVKKLLEMLGCTVIEAESGKEALDIWPDVQDDVSLVVSDVAMPEGVSGWDLARELHRARPDLGILITSGYCQTPEELDLGGNDQLAFLQKPYESNRLKATLSELLGNN